MGGSEVPSLVYASGKKLGMKEFIVRVPKEYFHLDEDAYCPVVFHDMCRLLRRKDLDVAQALFLPCKFYNPALL